MSLRQELERHIYEDTIVDGDILRKFRIPETVLSGRNFGLEFSHVSLYYFTATAGFPFTKDGESSRGLCLQKASNVLRDLVEMSRQVLKRLKFRDAETMSPEGIAEKMWLASGSIDDWCRSAARGSARLAMTLMTEIGRAHV